MLEQIFNFIAVHFQTCGSLQGTEEDAAKIDEMFSTLLRHPETLSQKYSPRLKCRFFHSLSAAILYNNCKSESSFLIQELAYFMNHFLYYESDQAVIQAL